MVTSRIWGTKLSNYYNACLRAYIKKIFKFMAKKFCRLYMHVAVSASVENQPAPNGAV